MSCNDQHKIPVAYPPPPPAAVMGMEKPVGYPTMMDATDNQVPAQTHTQSRGDGFWKGCCAALCCCCVLDACF